MLAHDVLQSLARDHDHNTSGRMHDDVICSYIGYESDLREYKSMQLSRNALQDIRIIREKISIASYLICHCALAISGYR